MSAETADSADYRDPEKLRAAYECHDGKLQDVLDVTEYDGEQFCLSLACEKMVVDGVQPEPPDLVRDVLVPIWPMFVWALFGAFVLSWSTPDATLFDLELHQQVYSLLGYPVIIYSLYRVYRWRRAENVD